MTLRTLSSLGDLAGKRVLVRCDFNVPLDESGQITDDGRIRAALPTLNALLESGAALVVISHLGRPKGEPNAKYSLKPVASRLGELLQRDVAFARDTVGEHAQAAVSSLKAGGVLVLENLRFNAGETSKDASERAEFAGQLAALGEAFISDGFGVVHRKQASVFELAQALPSAAGLLVEREVSVLSRLTDQLERPYAVVLGGSKVSDKLGVIDNLLPKVDTLIVGGGMVFTFLAAQGYSVGASLLEADHVETVRSYLKQADERGVEILLPTDIVVADRFASDAEHCTVPADAIESSPFGASGIGLDIGPASGAAFADAIRRSQTVFWNGPMGVFEFDAFAGGTKAVAAGLAECNGLTVVGGGDSASAVRHLGFADTDFTHISTGGGASLEFVEGKSLPGLEVLGW